MNPVIPSGTARLEADKGRKSTWELGELIRRSDLSHVLYSGESLQYYLRKEGVPKFYNWRMTEQLLKGRRGSEIKIYDNKNSLLEKEGMRGKVQCVYIDPPYGIKFGSNWQVSTRKRDVKDNKVDDLVRQPEQVKAFRDTWELGIHSYLSYLRDRLVTARELLSDTGSCFLQINDDNVHLIRNVMDEVFGANNFIA